MEIKKAFSLIEVLIGVFLLSVIALFMFPSLYQNIKDSNRAKELGRLSLSLQAGIELGKEMDVGSDLDEMFNGQLVNIKVRNYREDANLIEIIATCKDHSYSLVEEKDE